MRAAGEGLQILLLVYNSYWDSGRECGCLCNESDYVDILFESLQKHYNKKNFCKNFYTALNYLKKHAD